MRPSAPQAILNTCQSDRQLALKVPVRGAAEDLHDRLGGLGDEVNHQRGEAIIPLPEIGVTLALADLYEGIDFEAEAAALQMMEEGALYSATGA